MALLLASRAARGLRPRCRASAATVFFARAVGNTFPSIPSSAPLRQTLSLASITSFSTSGNPNKEEDEEEKPWNRRSAESNSSWIDLYLPGAVRPYALLARLDKPIGTWLLAWPCFWSITMAAQPGEFPDLKMLALFGVTCGAMLLRDAGCTVNDLLDRDIDVKVERTKYRPFASGLLTPYQGVGFLGVQLLLGLGILLQLNNYCQILGALSLLLVFSYPLMKRLTFWPQAYLGLTFNWGALLGWAAIKGNLDPPIVLPLYSSGVFWTLVYDTIYAHQDKEDDLKVGVKSTALRFGDLTKNWISGFGIACIGSLLVIGFNAELAWPYYLFLTGAAGQLGWQVLTVDLSDRSDCNRNPKALLNRQGCAQASVEQVGTGLAHKWTLGPPAHNQPLLTFPKNVPSSENRILITQFVSTKWFGALVFSVY
ncbi:LOW QUALITY PROTEIN: 4-hydroxybenzoate polyprenyltransferase, mitochondrial-like [Dioscorea cayenensis subsp. rotundata]|uniref:4-hydroxybenzoate polyprenyltransferase, mitochondrial n=1 Tax=Dioscorea cayennensis subsp. rotundata TaxID=55577 RepID=A0AB40CS37_DIOCR|nr:LOW QUALITY PROTEIN: 4-hydroxybenzoate polyprenyltransferase, mitochondrial-like [Dioscorea cayenensis subsp. rotundata]